ncbi:MAG: reverse transcriptase domain-containing protein [Acutalibacter sp.]|jgi:RNA-directed DNA polymerase
MTKFPIKQLPPIMPPATYDEAVGYDRIETHYKEAIRGPRKYKREAVNYDLYRELNNVNLWRDLRSGRYAPGPYYHTIITEPKTRALSIPKLRDKIVQLVIHEELQNIYRPVFVDRSFACQYGKGPIRAAYNVQRDMRVARMKWGDDATVIKLDVKKFFYSIDRDILKKVLAKRFKKLKKKHPEKYQDFLKFYKLLCKVIDSSPEGEKGIPLGNVSSQDFANIYLNELDQYCIRYLGAKLYTRYMDDVVIIAPNMETAREWLTKIKAFLKERLHLETNSKTKIFYVRQGVNAYGFKIKATHLLIRTESKRAEKRRIKKLVEKMEAGLLTKKDVINATGSWLGFARWASAYNLCKKIFAPYPFIKVEGEMQFGYLSRNRQIGRFLQQWGDYAPAY